MKSRYQRNWLWVLTFLIMVIVLVIFSIKASADVNGAIERMQFEVQMLRELAARQEEVILQQRQIIEGLQSLSDNQPCSSEEEPALPDRIKGRELTPITMRVTAYDLSYESCKKYPDHPEYGITASGNKVVPWFTVAAGPELAFGTKLFIPYFKDKPNGGIFVVQDRGSAIKENCLDIYMESHEECMAFGVKYLDVYILD